MNAVNERLKGLPFDGAVLADALGKLQHPFVQLLAMVLRERIPTRFVAEDMQTIEDQFS